MADEKQWKPLELVKVTADYLASKGVDSPKLDAEILLCEALGLKQRIELYAGFEQVVEPERLARYRAMVRRRAAREPVSRILGAREFMGKRFAVNQRVLSPRPETEMLVEAVIAFFNPKTFAIAEEEPETAADNSELGDALQAELSRLLDSYGEDIGEEEIDEEPDPQPETLTLRQAARQRSSRRQCAAARPCSRPEQPAGKAGEKILELGTGSGCIAVALAAALPQAALVAVDISREALDTAAGNARRLGLDGRIEFRLGDWFSSCRPGEAFDAIVSNPPYLVEGDPAIWPEVADYDPPLALYGGSDGLACYKKITAEAPAWLRPGGGIFLEVGSGQAEAVSSLLQQYRFSRIERQKDYAGCERLVQAIAGV